MDKIYNRIVLIGNGFDLALGLDTNYTRFIFSYMKNCIVETFKSKTWNTIGCSLRSDPNLPKFVDDYLKELDSCNDLNVIFDYLKNKIEIKWKSQFLQNIVNGFTQAKWIDIEQYYYDTLKTYFNLYKTSQSKERELARIIDLNKCMDELTNALNVFISNQQSKITFEKMFEQMYSLFNSIGVPLRDGRSSLINRYNRQNAPERILFLNFNYTNTLSNLISTASTWKNYNYISIHGSVNNEESPIIFGYGDDTGEDYRKMEDEGENELLRKIKSFQYPRTNNYHTLLNFLEINEFDVFIIGHSCGLSDRTLLKTIFEHRNCLALQNFHYKGEEEDFNKRMEISRHFTDKIQMREKVLPYDESARIPQAR